MKQISHFRYRKLDPEKVLGMKRYKDFGYSYKDIALIFKVAPSTVQYHLDKGYKEKSLKRSNKYNSKLTKKQKRRISKKRRKYNNQYIMDRYHNDEEFRIKFIKSSIKYQKKKRRLK